MLDIREPLTYNLRVKDKAPITAGTVIGARTAQPKPYRSDNPSIRLLAVNHKEIHSDVPQLPDRNDQTWKAPRWNAALPLLSMR